MRLIDADTLEREGWFLSRNRQVDSKTMVYEVKKPTEFPTIEPERKIGKWIYEEDGIIHGHCSCCGFHAIYQETDVFGYDFCPNCGADMRGEQDE